jgi:hypothetical protein
MLVDRYRFREMLDSTTGQDVWPGGMVAVLSLDFAKQPDVRESLAATRWDLVIADEAHSIRGARAEALRQVGASAERVVLATLPDLETPDAFPAEDATVVEWRRDRVVDHDGKRLDAVPRPVLHEVRFSLTPAEMSLRATVGDLCQSLGGATGAEGLRAMTLLRSLESSPVALETALQRLTAGLTAQEDMEQLLESPDEEALEERLTGRIDRPSAEEAVGVARRALQEIEKISSDSKLGAFGELLNHLNKAKMPFRGICAITDYLATLYYLAAEIEGRGMTCHLLHGGMGPEDRHRSATLFASTGGILLATRAAISEGVTLGEVTDLVLYDIPPRKVALQQLLGRFDRFGRLSQLNVHVLVPSNVSDRHISEPLGFLHEVVGSPPSASASNAMACNQPLPDPQSHSLKEEISDSGIITPFFDRYIGIDYSGAQTPTSSLRGLRIFLADRASLPVEIEPPPSPRKYWTRRGIAEWLVDRLREDRPTLIGIDHGFSFPQQYFEAHDLQPNWPAFLDDFQRHWPTDEDHTYVDFVRDGARGKGAARSGDTRWRRLTEIRAGTAKSVFQFDVQGSVAKSTHAGLPWLRYIRQKLGDRVHFWPFDGWDIPAGRSVVAEVYPSLWSRGFAREGRTADQHDAYVVATWMRGADLDGSLAGFFNPSLPAPERTVAQIEGWILGVR